MFSKNSAGSRKPFFSKKREKTSSAKKTQRDAEQKNRFVKPPHDPGSKYRDQETDDNSSYPENSTGDYVQQTPQSSGGGCLGSIAGLVKFVVFAILVIIVVLIFKCG